MNSLMLLEKSNADKKYFDNIGGDTLNVTGTKIQIVNVHLDRFNQITVKDKKIEVNLRSVLRFAKNEILGDSVRSQSAKELIQWLGEKKLNFPVAPRIDFLFLSPNLHCRQASVLPMSPGDHFPVKAVIGVRLGLLAY